MNCETGYTKVVHSSVLKHFEDVNTVQNEVCGYCFDAQDYTGIRPSNMPLLHLERKVSSRLKQTMSNESGAAIGIVCRITQQTIPTLPLRLNDRLTRNNQCVQGHTHEIMAVVVQQPSQIKSLPVVAASGVSRVAPPEMSLPAEAQASDFQNTLIGVAEDRQIQQHGKSFLFENCNGDICDITLPGDVFHDKSMIKTEIMGFATAHQFQDTVRDVREIQSSLSTAKRGSFSSEDLPSSMIVVLDVHTQNLLSETMINEGGAYNRSFISVKANCVTDGIATTCNREVGQVDALVIGCPGRFKSFKMIDLLNQVQRTALLAAINKDQVEFGFPVLPSTQDFDVSKITVDVCSA